MRVLHQNKMRLLILLQIFIATVNISDADHKTKSAVILNDLHTEMSAEVMQKQNGSTNELFGNLGEIGGDGNNLDFDYDDKDSLKMDAKEQELQEVLLKAMKKPAIRKQIGEVIPILRVMSPAQRLTLAAMVCSQIMSQYTLSEENLAEIAAVFGNKGLEDKDDRHNITEHLLLPISMDIAKMFKGLGKEMGRNLRQNFYGPSNAKTAENTVRRVTRKPNFRNQDSMNRRMYDVNYDQPGEKSATNMPTADMLKQPGKDECDYFTKNLCLEVSNYPTEAIILSLKRNKDIANSFLTDFEVHSAEEPAKNFRGNGSGRRLERRKDGQNEVQDSPPGNDYMCPSALKYARPKRARTTSGQWKYIVNAGDYTQTLRLEICQKPKSPCSYVTNHLNSECTQIYNYHRLLTWDEGKGLHMDIFKVPSCCSCHIQGYSTFFPPNQDFAITENRREPLKGSSLVMEAPRRPPYGYLGNKREVPKNIPPGNAPLMSTQNHSLLLVSTKELFQNPADHLVPAGPPLPLENEKNRNSYLESKYNQEKLALDLKQRYPAQVQYRRVINRVIEGSDSLQEQILPLNDRLKTPNSTSERVNPKFSKNHYQETISRGPQEINPIFHSSNKIYFLKPSAGTPLPFLNLDGHREKPNSSGMFAIPKPDPVPSLVTKANFRPPPQYFKPKFPDSKGLPNKISPSYVTPSKVGIVSQVSTTGKPEYAVSNQKKINYNYHPIIDFFVSELDTKKRQPTFSSLQYLPLTPQDWTPVAGH